MERESSRTFRFLEKNQGQAKVGYKNGLQGPICLNGRCLYELYVPDIHNYVVDIANDLYLAWVATINPFTPQRTVWSFLKKSSTICFSVGGHKTLYTLRVYVDILFDATKLGEKCNITW